ncbi:MAG TPA: ATP-binding cassette domain-containing protein, partial [Alphaproteobacteria bacterium]|nr:ATP-binding cassette domain-containing protein [Alphaproteobacteria bacterium]
MNLENSSQKIDDVVLKTVNLAKYYNLKNGFFGKVQTLKAVNGVHLSLKTAQTLAIVGESGSGKSTLARMITLIERPTLGQLFLQGQDVSNPNRSTLKQFRPFVQMIFQNPSPRIIGQVVL